MHGDLCLDSEIQKAGCPGRDPRACIRSARPQNDCPIITASSRRR
ncbi:Uncharacterized protein ChrSV_0552 [Chromobacterium vaccinii]|nr:Uncharacterized protein ChrSW_0552 [Chromobacterium vaccinii]QND88011.1 Uncharacterized protein ChrSV_0552 [Chromobacterium vaccinii]